MRESLYKNEFSKVLSRLLEGGSATCYGICNYAGVDPAYLSRLKNGEKANPSLETVVRISLGLVHCSNSISVADIEQLLNSTGRSLRIG